MKVFRIKDNKKYYKYEFSDVQGITDVIADKTFEQLEREGVFIFPEIIKDADDLSRNQMILQSHNDRYMYGI